MWLCFQVLWVSREEKSVCVPHGGRSCSQLFPWLCRRGRSYRSQYNPSALTWVQPPDTEVAQSSGFSAWSGMGRYFKNSHQSNLKKISSSSLLRKGLAPTPGRLLLTSSVLLLLPSWARDFLSRISKWIEEPPEARVRWRCVRKTSI